MRVADDPDISIHTVGGAVSEAIGEAVGEMESETVGEAVDETIGETEEGTESDEEVSDEDFHPATSRRGKQRSRRYFALKKHQLHTCLREELRDLKRFMTAPLVLDRQGGPIEKV